MAQRRKAKVGTNVPRSGLVHVDQIVVEFNTLNRAILAEMPAMARASETLQRQRPLIRRMQALLSQRPKDATDLRFPKLNTMVDTPRGLPSWTRWLTAYAATLDYSMRHVRRLIFDEPRMKKTQKCGWSITDHNRTRLAAHIGRELRDAIRAGVDTTALCDEMDAVEREVRGDLWSREYKPETRLVRKRPARRVTEYSERHSGQMSRV